MHCWSFILMSLLPQVELIYEFILSTCTALLLGSKVSWRKVFVIGYTLLIFISIYSNIPENRVLVTVFITACLLFQVVESSQAVRMNTVLNYKQKWYLSYLICFILKGKWQESEHKGHPKISCECMALQSSLNIITS